MFHLFRIQQSYYRTWNENLSRTGYFPNEGNPPIKALLWTQQPTHQESTTSLPDVQKPGHSLPSKERLKHVWVPKGKPDGQQGTSRRHFYSSLHWIWCCSFICALCKYWKVLRQKPKIHYSSLCQSQASYTTSNTGKNCVTNSVHKERQYIYVYMHAYAYIFIYVHMYVYML